jgi:hypothetical protein
MNLHPKPNTNFYVHASNIHTDEFQQYGPFPGEPGLTYELLRCWSDEGHPMDGDHLFEFRENWRDATFRHDDGENVRYGWRRTYQHWNTYHTGHDEPDGPLWTDLTIAHTNDPTLPNNYCEHGRPPR